MRCQDCEGLREELSSVRIYLAKQLKIKGDLEKELRIVQGVLNGVQKELDGFKKASFVKE